MHSYKWLWSTITSIV